MSTQKNQKKDLQSYDKERDDTIKAPGFNKDNWLDFADDEWDSSTNEFYTTFIHPINQINNKDIQS